jgi:hypothetical protein
MNLQIDFWSLVGLFTSGLGVLVGVLKFTLAQAQKHQDTTHAQLLSRLDVIEQSNKDGAEQWRQVERDLARLRAELPLEYVRRDDHIRTQSVIESKLDALASKLEAAQLRAVHHPAGDTHAL